MTNCLTTRDRTLLIRTPILPQATEAWKQHQQALVSLIYPALPSTLRRQEHQDDYTIARRSAYSYGPYHLIDDTGYRIPYDRAVPIDQMKVALCATFNFGGECQGKVKAKTCHCVALTRKCSFKKPAVAIRYSRTAVTTGCDVILHVGADLCNAD